MSGYAHANPTYAAFCTVNGGQKNLPTLPELPDLRFKFGIIADSQMVAGLGNDK